jgi:hypothetical protein
MFAAVALKTGEVLAQETQAAAFVHRQLLEDAWWTGPLLAAGAGTLPQGHALIEPYLYDVIRYGRFDLDGAERTASRTHSYRSLTYMLYGVTDDFTAGLIPVFGFNDVSKGSGGSSVQAGDLTVQGQYRLSQFREGSRMPTTSLVIQQTLPTAKHDRLGSHPNSGFGAGVYTTSVALYSQHYLWMPNGRIVRTRLNVSYAFSNDGSVTDVSVYGTGPGFRGRVAPGDSFTVNSAWEYSITRNWVFALDLLYQHDDNTRLTGFEIDPVSGASERVEENFGSAWRFGLAPAIEYNFNARIGIIVGARWFTLGRNTSATITPAVALNVVF